MALERKVLRVRTGYHENLSTMICGRIATHPRLTRPMDEVKPMDVIYRFDPDLKSSPPPRTPDEATARLRQGNDDFIRLSSARAETQETHVIHVPPSWFDLWQPPGTIPDQEPFAVVLGCSDARVPTEIIFNQPRNDLFIVRVAGNVLGSECLGSVEYAGNNLAGKLRLVVVLGHGSCGAVTAAVDAFLDPARYPEIASSQALRAVIDRIFISVRAASRTIRTIWGQDVVDRDRYRDALIDVSVAFNAALTAWTLRSELPPRILQRVGVVFGIFDLLTHRVWSPATDGKPEIAPGLAAAPSERESFRQVAEVLGKSDRVRALLEA
jgi:carbonic anhydrase